jgi:signal transduction histidine kinase/DNA-binding NarL/FixJ family response regulator
MHPNNRKIDKSIINRDLLVLYIKNHARLAWLPIVAIFCFLLVYGYVYKFPLELEAANKAGGLLGIALAFFIVQQFYYRRLLKKTISPNQVMNVYIKVAVCKLLYILPWLLMLFYPYEGLKAGSNIVGYTFIFLASAFYISVSSQCLFLFIWDVSVHIIIFCVVAVVSKDYFHYFNGYLGVPDFLMLVLMFYLYILHSGYNIHKTTRDYAKGKVKLARSAQLAKSTSKAKTDFLGMMSHEIRTPLTGIIGMLDHLKDTTLNIKQREYLNTIILCSENLLNTLNDALDLSKVESGKFEIEHIPMSIRDIVKSTSEILRPKFEEKGLTFNVTIDESIPSYIKGDPNRLSQILSNLLSNALKFTEEGEVSLAIKNTSTRSIIIVVKDTGIGINKEQQKKLFERYSQADVSISRKYGGTGLGLSIIKQLTELMGGNVKLISDSGKGTCFIIKIPYETVLKKDFEKVKQITKAYITNLNILVVEDNKINQEIVSKILEKYNHDITIASSGSKAIKAIEKEDYNLILMDMNLPDMNGISVTRAIRGMGPEYQIIPILALSADASEKKKAECLEAGMLDYILKPINKDELLSKITKHTEDQLDDSDKYIVQLDTRSIDNSIDDNIKDIEEAMGKEYVSTFLRDALDEMDVLRKKISTSVENNDMEAAMLAAHDLKAITGTLGLNELYNVSEELEKASEASLPESKLIELNAKINSLIESDAEVVRSKIRSG